MDGACNLLASRFRLKQRKRMIVLEPDLRANIDVVRIAVRLESVVHLVDVLCLPTEWAHRIPAMPFPCPGNKARKGLSSNKSHTHTHTQQSK